MGIFQRSTKLRLRRAVRRQKKQVDDIGEAADANLDKHFFGRLGQLTDVRRFVIGWVSLVLLLSVAIIFQASALRDKYQSTQPVPGGTFIEGIVGRYTNVNPLYATGSVDAAVSKLVFAGLFKYDNNNQLTPDLAEKIDVDSSEKKYTVTLKPNLKWHDGQPLTAKDVVFTYQLIQNPDSRSFMQPSWKGVTMEAKDDRTVVFTLPSNLSAFPHSLTNGIIPQHLLANVSPEQLRSNEFNTVRPVGAGPFRFEELEIDRAEPEKQDARVALVPNTNYHFGSPKLGRYIIKTYQDQKSLEKAYTDKEVTAISGLPAAPDSYQSDESTVEYSLPVAGQVMAFFKTSQAPLNNKDVRQALVLAADRQKLISATNYPLLPSDSPLLKSQLGYNKQYTQSTGNLKKAQQLLDKAKWRQSGDDPIRKQKGAPLKLRLFAEANSEYAAVAGELQKEWRALGIDTQVTLQPASDLQVTASRHNYDVFLTAISTGADPDVFAYWHSSQSDIRSNTRLNFSEYNSPRADASLEAGRTRSDPALRPLKYMPFLQVWSQDNPALAIYQPRFLFVVRKPFYNFGVESVVTPVDRYSNVHEWMIRDSRQ